MKNILIFNDISGIGNCSMAANLPIFSKLGHYCMPVVTACYSCQTGFANFAVTPNPNVVDFAKRIAANIVPDAMYVGFCNDIATLNGIIEVVRDVLPKDAYLFVDPIMGDNGKLYPVFDEGYVELMGKVVSLADCISPNLTEACLLCGINYEELTSHKNDSDYIERCKKLFENFLSVVNVQSAVITGISQADKISNIVIDGKGIDVVTTDRINVEFSGTGDAFSSVLLGELLCGKTLLQSATAAANFVSNASAKTTRTDRRFGVDFCKFLDML